MDKWTGGWLDEWTKMNGWINGLMDGWMGG